MTVSRRSLLKLTGAGLAVAGTDLGLLVTRGDAAASSAPSGGPFLTTLNGTVALDAPGAGGYRRLKAGPAEPHLVRSELAADAGAPVPRAVAAFAQMTDLHIVDDQSPMRFEFFELLADP